MKIRYKYTVDDMVVFTRYHYSQANERRSHRRQALLYGAVGLLLVMMFLSLLEKGPKVLVLGGFFIGFYCLLIRRARTSGIEKAVRRLYNPDSKEFLGEQVLEINDEGVCKMTDFSECKHKWTGVPRIETYNDYAFIYIGSTDAHIIPKKSVLEGDFDAFVETAKSLWEKRVTVARPFKAED